MKLLKIILVLTITITFSACTTKYAVIHSPFIPTEQCIFERLTEQEKSTMSEATKMKLGRNYKGCFITRDAEKERIEKHNELHAQ